jgi:hypothetical protein
MRRRKHPRDPAYLAMGAVIGLAIVVLIAAAL